MNRMKPFLLCYLLPLFLVFVCIFTWESCKDELKFKTAILNGVIEVKRDGNEGRCVVVGMNPKTKELWYKQVAYPRFFIDAKPGHQYIEYSENFLLEGKHKIHLTDRSKIK
jgi:hypothetical protein